MGGLANNGPCAGEFQQPVIRLSAPLIAHLEARLNRTNDGVARTDLGALPAELEKIDAWIADGTIGDPQHPNAADLQLASTIRLILTFGDARPVLLRAPTRSQPRRSRRGSRCSSSRS